MANNRMWLRHKTTGQQVLIAKFYPSGGWEVFHDHLADVLQQIFYTQDFTIPERAANAAAISAAKNPFAGPYKAASSDVNGEVWELVYDR